MVEKKGLTHRQQTIFNFVRDFIHLRSKPPTLREIGAEFGIKSTNGVRSALTALSKKGYISMSPKISRGIELTEREGRLVSMAEIIERSLQAFEKKHRSASN